MRDRANQTVLGTFLGIFVYCVVVLRTIRGGDEGAFVPSLAVLFAMLLALVGIGCLIFFIHHIASSIQAESIIQLAANETLNAIDRIFPAALGEAADTGLIPERESALSGMLWLTIPARLNGFLLGIDNDALLDFARQRGAIVRMEHGIGEFVVAGAPLVSVAGGKPSGEETVGELNAFFTVGHQRTTVQDAGFGIRQIVDIALKALSPGINDTTTAVTCVNYLTAVLARLATQHIETAYRLDNGELRVIARGPSFSSMLGEAFDQIRRNAEGNVAVLLALLEALEVVAGRTQDAGRLQTIARQVELIAEVARSSIPSFPDREGIEAALERHRKRGVTWTKN